jgi:hypothetical protein
MSATEVIEIYINDTVRLLPRRLRSDVAAELRSLLTEELHARAQESGRPPDKSMALALVRAQGSPNEAAARYQAPWAIIDPADSTSFLRASIIGACALSLFSQLSTRQPEMHQTADALIKVGIPAWLGILVLVFGVRSWIRRHRPKTSLWQPHDRDRVSRLGVALCVPPAAAVVVLYAAPAWVLDTVSRGRIETGWAAYTDDFQWSRLPALIGMLVAMLVLLCYAAIRGRWTRRTRHINIGLNLCQAILILVAAIDGDIFRSEGVDQIARKVLSLVGAIYLPCVGVMIYGEIGRLDPVVTTTNG